MKTPFPGVDIDRVHELPKAPLVNGQYADCDCRECKAVRYGLQQALAPMEWPKNRTGQLLARLQMFGLAVMPQLSEGAQKGLQALCDEARELEREYAE